MNIKGIALSVMLALPMAACGGTETGNPGAASVALGLRASDPAVVDVEATAGGSHVTALLVAVERAALIGCASVHDEELVLARDAIVDLVAGSPTIAVAPGRYCGVRLVLAPADLPMVEGAPPVAGATVAAHGVRADDVPFTLVSRSPRTIQTDITPFTLQARDAFIFAFDVSTWLGRGLLDAAPVVDGRAIVDGTGDLGAQFDRQVAGGLFDDVSSDGRIEPDEATPVVDLPPGQE
jgi:hypothetical protein